MELAYCACYFKNVILTISIRELALTLCDLIKDRGADNADVIRQQLLCGIQVVFCAFDHEQHCI